MIVLPRVPRTVWEPGDRGGVEQERREGKGRGETRKREGNRRESSMCRGIREGLHTQEQGVM